MLPTSDRGRGRRLHPVGGVVGLGGAAGLSSVSSHEPVTLTLEAPLRTLVNRRDRHDTDAAVRYATADGTLVALEASMRFACGPCVCDASTRRAMAA
jgi:hypothetical protein